MPTHKLTDLDVNEVSLVDAAAIKRKFLIQKRNEDGGEDTTEWPLDMNTLIEKADEGAEPPVVVDTADPTPEPIEAAEDVAKTLTDTAEGIIGDVSAAAEALDAGNGAEVARAMLAKLDAHRAELARLAGEEKEEEPAAAAKAEEGGEVKAGDENPLAKAQAALVATPTAEQLAAARTDDAPPVEKADGEVEESAPEGVAKADDKTEVHKALSTRIDGLESLVSGQAAAVGTAIKEEVAKFADVLRAGLLGTLGPRLAALESNVGALGRREGLPSSSPDDGDDMAGTRTSSAQAWPADMNDHPDLKR